MNHLCPWKEISALAVDLKTLRNGWCLGKFLALGEAVEEPRFLLINRLPSLMTLGQQRNAKPAFGSPTDGEQCWGMGVGGMGVWGCEMESQKHQNGSVQLGWLILST